MLSRSSYWHRGRVSHLPPLFEGLLFGGWDFDGGMLTWDPLMSSAKQDVEHLLNKLPDNTSVEDIQYHLYVLDKVRRGLEDARINGTLSQEEVETRLGKWLTE
jgi:hypothetical protein